ncbi:hypothetical protein Daus18300_004440 [Diaporthe australafricana]|uniref:YDG domain-containing protein n=1 Tax=Diaporthe australafricana TaxID=127596 RepID=A0ABR3X7Z7_9PEZI
MSPALNNRARIRGVLEAMFQRPDFFFPEDIKQRAEALHRRWEANGWSDGSSSSSSTAATATVASNSGNNQGVASPATAAPPANAAGAMIPPPNHRIWGQNGIMAGVVPVRGVWRQGQQLDRRYPRRMANHLGHNGLIVGDWFANQMCAVARGAHGEPIAGIFGDSSHGAYSIVVAKTYKDVDDDQGDTIFYSGPGSATNEDRNTVPTSKGAGRLQRSLTTGNHVRVLRAANSSTAFAPSVGIRYDGLYRVVRQELRRNPRGGLFVRYVLRRVAGQEPLGSIWRRSPTARQMRDHRRIRNPW